MTTTAKTAYAWCFSHGRMHTFQAGQVPWCTASWIALVASSEEEAAASKVHHYGDARFLHELPGDQQLEVIESRRTWDRIFDEGMST